MSFHLVINTKLIVKSNILFYDSKTKSQFYVYIYLNVSQKIHLKGFYVVLLTLLFASRNTTTESVYRLDLESNKDHGSALIQLPHPFQSGFC